MAIGNAGSAAAIQRQASTTIRFKSFLNQYFYFIMSLAMTAIIVAGFSRTVNDNLLHATPPRPWLLWVHGTIFSAWMVFFIAQSALVRVRQVSVHRLIGWFGATLAASMVVVGCIVSVVMTRFHVALHDANADQAFMSIPFVDMAIFGTLVAAAIYWRKKPEHHRRLLFIATCSLMDAGIGRFDFWFNHSIFYVGLDLLILLGVVRDLAVNGRIHKVYVYALPPLMVLQAFAIYLWRGNPVWWQAMTHAILGM